MTDQTTEAPHNRLPPHERPTTDREQSGGESKPGSAADLFAPLLAHLGELSEYASYYFAAQADRVKAKVRTVVIYAVAGAVAAVVGVTALVVATTMLLIGIGGGLGELMTNRPWAGYLVTGVLLLAVTFGSLRLMLPQWSVHARQLVKEKYDRRRQSQRTRFGHDVDEVRKN